MIPTHTNYTTQASFYMTMTNPFLYGQSRLATRYATLVSAVNQYVSELIAKAEANGEFVEGINERILASFLLNRLYFIPAYGTSFKTIKDSGVICLENYATKRMLADSNLARRTSLGILDTSIRMLRANIPYKYMRQVYSLKKQDGWLETFIETVTEDKEVNK